MSKIECPREVYIYGTPNCVYCKMAKEFLTERNVEFTYFDVADDPIAMNHMEEISGQRGVPVIEIEGEVQIGFSKAKLQDKLKII